MRFADREARGRSAIYERLATSISEDDSLLRLIAELPRSKQQPNLVLAAARKVCGLIADPHLFAEAARAAWPAIREVVLQRSTQTNEPGRCAVLLPLLASLPQPLALIEVGASAGLCLVPDRYGYRFDGHHEVGSGNVPIFPCATSGEGTLPTTLPTVTWRRGLDLSPVDLRDPEHVQWLETLVWPGEEERLERLRAAVRTARAHAPVVHRGDLRSDLRTLILQAPDDATVVVFHTAVLAYLQQQRERDAFATEVRELGATWISNEAPSVFPCIAARLPRQAPVHRFILALDGNPVALTGPHGQSLDWL